MTTWVAVGRTWNVGNCTLVDPWEMGTWVWVWEGRCIICSAFVNVKFLQ